MGNGGIFNGHSALGTFGLGDTVPYPYPDVYGCNKDGDCQSNWCNTAIPAGNAAGQCQTKGKVNPGIGGQGNAGSYCSSDDNCQIGLTCNLGKKMCESPSDPGNGCYYATQIGFQAGLSGMPRSPATGALSAISSAGLTASPEILAQLQACYTDGYNKGVAQAKLDARPCSSVGVISQVQVAIGRPKTGVWTAADEAAMKAKGKTFKSIMPKCTGAVPTPTGGTVTPPVKPPPVQVPPATITPAYGKQPAASGGFLAQYWWLLLLGAMGVGGVVLMTSKKKTGATVAGAKSKSGKSGVRSIRSKTRKSGVYAYAANRLR